MAPPTERQARVSPPDKDSGMRASAEEQAAAPPPPAARQLAAPLPRAQQRTTAAALAQAPAASSQPPPPPPRRCAAVVYDPRDLEDPYAGIFFGCIADGADGGGGCCVLLMGGWRMGAWRDWLLLRRLVAGCWEARLSPNRSKTQLIFTPSPPPQPHPYTQQLRPASSLASQQQHAHAPLIGCAVVAGHAPASPSPARLQPNPPAAAARAACATPAFISVASSLSPSLPPPATLFSPL